MVCGFGRDARGVHRQQQEGEEMSNPEGGSSPGSPSRRPRRRAVAPSSHTDEKWPEVMFINDYAVFIGYLSMAVTGTGFLVFTWSTVVLLGGFVTLLDKKDFWCLTVITLVQTRVFDAFLNGNISYIGYSFKRLWEAIALPQHPFRKWSARGLIRVLVFTVVLCPLFALYMFGLFVSPGISLWRLVQQDYGNTARDSSKANLKPALVVLYSMALFQGVLFYYRAICSLEEPRLLTLVARAYGLDDNDKARGSISDYLREMRVGCEKDTSFARGKNLVTYAAELMQSNSPDSYVSAVRIIDTLIRLSVSTEKKQKNLLNQMVGSAASSHDDAAARNLVKFMRTRVPDSVVKGQHMLMADMIGSASSGAIKKFVQMLDSRSHSYSNEEIRLRAMRIVAHFASEIRLSKIPYAIQCVSSLFKKKEEDHGNKAGTKKEEDHGNKGTIIRILWKLTEDEENLRFIMSNSTPGLASNIIEMLVHKSNGRDHPEHDIWCSDIAVPGMEIIKRFTFVIKESKSNNMRLAREILGSTDAIKTLERMLECQRCKMEEELQKSVIMVLTQITSMGTSLPMGPEVKKRLHKAMTKLVSSLIAIFLDDGDDSDGKSSMKKLAGKSLVQLSCVNENSATILQAKDGRIVSLTQVVLDKESKYRKSAADILKHLCSHYTTKEESHFRKLKKAMIDDVILEVLKEVLEGCRTKPKPSLFDDDFLDYISSEYNVEEQEALSSLCTIVNDRLISQDSNLASRFDQKAEEICRDMKIKGVVNFADLVKKAADDVASKKASQDKNDSWCCIM